MDEDDVDEVEFDGERFVVVAAVALSGKLRQLSVLAAATLAIVAATVDGEVSKNACCC